MVPPGTGGAERPFQNALIVPVIGPRRFPPPWSVEERPTAFVSGDHNGARVCPLTVIIFTFLVPGVLLRKLVSLASIASAIRNDDTCCWIRTYLAARSIEKRTRCERIDHYLQASILMIIRDVFCCDRNASASRQLGVLHFS
jgi:hypothetical protein